MEQEGLRIGQEVGLPISISTPRSLKIQVPLNGNSSPDSIVKKPSTPDDENESYQISSIDLVTDRKFVGDDSSLIQTSGDRGMLDNENINSSSSGSSSNSSSSSSSSINSDNNERAYGDQILLDHLRR